MVLDGYLISLDVDQANGLGAGWLMTVLLYLGCVQVI